MDLMFLLNSMFSLFVIIENSLVNNRLSTYGVIILEKDVNKIVNYFQVYISIRDKFNRLLNILKVLNFLNRE